MSFFALIALLMTAVLFLHAVFAPVEIETEAVPRDKPQATELLPAEFNWKAVTLPRIGVFLLAALGFWISLSAVVPALAWAVWIGDNEHWFWHAWPYVTAALALLATLPLIYRTLATRVGNRFFSVQAFFASAVNGLWAAFWLALLVEPILATDPLAAVRAIVRDYGHDPHDFTYVATEESVHFPKDPKNYRTYIVMGPEEPRARITVRRHLYYSWKQVGVSWFTPSSQQLAKARQTHGTRNASSVQAIAEGILQDFPNTPAAQEAEQLLQELDGKAGR